MNGEAVPEMVQNFEVFSGVIFVKSLTICACQIFHKLSTIWAGECDGREWWAEIVKYLTISQQNKKRKIF